MAASSEKSPNAILRLVAWLRTRIFEMCLVFMSFFQGAAILTYFQVVPIRRPEVRWLLRTWGWSFVWLARWVLGVRYRIEGQAEGPQGPVFYISNHQSAWESIALSVFIRDVNIVTKRELMDIPVFGWGLKHSPMIPVDRGKHGSNLRRILRDGAAGIREGRSILIFPEGTRVPPGEQTPYARGIALLYARFGVPVVPIVHDAGVFWRKGFTAKRPGLITVRFLPAIPAGRDPETLAAEIEDLLNREKERLPGTERLRPPH